MSFLNPAAWNGISIVSLIIVLAAGFVMALFRGWIILGIHHRELMLQNARELAAMEKRSTDDQESIAKFADAAARSTAAAEVQQSIVRAIRQIAEERAP